MNLVSGNLFWIKNSKQIKKYDYLTNNITTDVLVIGGGISGAITAYFLSKQGIKVTLVDKNIIGRGSTSATTSLLEYQVDIDLYKLKDLIGDEQATNIFSLCKDAITDIENISKEIGRDIEFERKDVIYYSNRKLKESDMLKEFYERKNKGFDVEYITTNDIFNLKTGIKTKNSSAVINPYLFTESVIEYLNKNNKNKVEVYENTEIVDVICKDNNVECITNNDYKITANSVIFATGFDTIRYINKDNYKLYKTFTIVTEKINELKDYNTNFTGRDTNSPYHYLRFTKDNRIMYGGEDVILTKRYQSKENLNKTAENKYLKLKSSLEKFFNLNKNLQIEYAFNGTFATTDDSLPLIDEIPNMKHCYCNLGYGSNGVLYSTIGAKMLTNIIKSNNSTYPKEMEMFKLDRKLSKN